MKYELNTITFCIYYNNTFYKLTLPCLCIGKNGVQRVQRIFCKYDRLCGKLLGKHSR